MKYNDVLLKLVIKVSITIRLYFQRYLSYHSLSYLFQSWLRVEKCAFFVNHSEEIEWKKEREKDKQASFYCTWIINHIFTILINECENKVTLHKTIKASFFSLLVWDKLDLFIYNNNIRYINQWRHITLMNEWEWQHSLVLFKVETSI
jgi:hypothetical protein